MSSSSSSAAASEYANVWEPIFDSSSGRSYYLNTATGETTWDPPPGTPPGVEGGSGEGAAAAAAGAGAGSEEDAGLSSSSSSSQLPEGWQELTTEDGTAYYWNHTTQETSWEKPQ